MVEKQHSSLSITGQCRLLGIHRSGLYYQPCSESEETLGIMRQLDEQYFKTPFYGVRRLTVWLQSLGYIINRKRVSRLMKLVGWQTIYRKPNTSKPNKTHQVYPYLLKNLEVNRVNHVWAMDITYVPMKRGFMYLCAVIDLHTRYVLNWSVSNSMTAEWCAQVVADATDAHGCPEILNTDQGSQFTSDVFIHLLIQKGIQPSMDGKGRAIDNIFIERLWKTVKYEYIYLKVPDDGVKLYQGLEEYFCFYNGQRPHQSLGYQTPAMLYRKAA
jgi:putative transposase